MGKDQEFLDACKNGSEEVVEKFLQLKNRKSLGIPSDSSTGHTGLHYAALHGHNEVVKSLLSHDADFLSPDKKGCTALHLACWGGYLPVVDTLLAYDPSGKSVNIRDNAKEVPLHFAAQYGHAEVVRSLIKAGAEANLRNARGETPLDLAARFGRLEAVRLMVASCPALVISAQTAAILSPVESAPNSFSPLHLAAKNGKTDVVRLLLDLGFDVNFVTESGTALHEAALFGKLNVVKLLLERGVDPTIRDYLGRTVVEILSEHQAQKSAEITQLIQSSEAWQSIRDMIQSFDTGSLRSTNSSRIVGPYENTLSSAESPIDTSIKSATDNAVWMTLPANSQERILHERVETPTKCICVDTTSDDNQSIDVPMGSPLSTISLSTTRADSAQDGGATPTLLQSVPPKQLESSSKPQKAPRMRSLPSDKIIKAQQLHATTCHYSYAPLPPRRYDNVPTKPLLPNYDNVPESMLQYDNAPIGHKRWVHDHIPSASEGDQKLNDSGISLETSCQHGGAEKPPKPQRCRVTEIVEVEKVPEEKSAKVTFVEESSHKTTQIRRRSSLERKALVTSGVYDNVPSTHHTDPNELSPGKKLIRFSNVVEYPIDIDTPTPETDCHSSVYYDAKSDLIDLNSDDLTTSTLIDQTISTIDQLSIGHTPPGSPKSMMAYPMDRNAEMFSSSPPPISRDKSLSFDTIADRHFGQKAGRTDVDSNFPVWIPPPPPVRSGRQANTLPKCFSANDSIEPQSENNLDVRAPLAKPESMNLDELGLSGSGIESGSTGSSDNVASGQFRFGGKRDGRQSAVSAGSPPNTADSKSPTSPSHTQQPKTPEFPPPDAFASESKIRKKIIPLSTELKRRSVETTAVGCVSTPANVSPEILSQGTDTDEAVTWGSETVEERSFSNKLTTTDDMYPPVKAKLSHKQESTDSEKRQCSDCKSRSHSCTCSDGEVCSTCSSTGELNEHQQQLLVDSNGQFLTRYKIATDNDSPLDEKAEWAQIDSILESVNNKILCADFKSYGQINPSYAPNDVTVDRWLAALGLSQYEELLISSGFDTLDYMFLLDSPTLVFLGVTDPADINSVLIGVDNLAPTKHLQERLAANNKFVSDWLLGLSLDEYVGIFMQSQCDTIQKVSQITELELITLLGITKLGHSRRILWSLGKLPTVEDDLKLADMSSSTISTGESQTYQWRHDPTELVENYVCYSAHYLGSTRTDELQTREAMQKAKKTIREIAKIPQISLQISYKGVKFVNTTTQRVICEHEIQHIHCICQDEKDMNCFAYITKEKNRHFCHVFSVLTADMATEIILALGQAFDIAYEMALDESRKAQLNQF